MAYPNGTPSANVNTIDSDTSFTPLNTVLSIRDNYTAIDKASLSNSLGRQVALVQNFVNATYLGRSGVPVQDAYISNLHNTSGFIDTVVTDAVVTDSVYSTSTLTMSGWDVDLITSDDIHLTASDDIHLKGNRIYIKDENERNMIDLATNYGVSIYGWNSSDTSFDILLDATTSDDGDIGLRANDQIDIIAGRHVTGHGPLNLASTYDNVAIYTGTSGNVTITTEPGYGGRVWIKPDEKLDLLCSGTMSIINYDPTADINVTSNKDINLTASDAFNLTTGGVIDIVGGSSVDIEGSNITISGSANTLIYGNGDIRLTGDVVGAGIGSVILDASTGPGIKLESLPTSDAALSTDYVWNSGGYLCIKS